MSLKPEEIARYARHISLENVGMEGQEKLKAAKVLVIGAGGLGCPILQYLTAAGVGTIGIVDHDVVDESNLQRQILYTADQTGTPKVEAAIASLSGLNSFVNLVPFQEKLNRDNVLEIFKEFDFILDGSDNFPTRYLVNDACVILDKPLVHGSIFKFDGQVSVFNYENGPSYRCLFPQPPSSEEVPNCSEVGVIGVLPGIIGTQMASECIKMILELGTSLSGTLLVVNTLANNFLKLNISRNDYNFNRTELEESYEEFCGVKPLVLENEIDVNELESLISNGKKITVIDVREQYELDICHIENTVHIPMGEVPIRASEVPDDHPVVFLCHHGIRSAQVIQYLNNNGFDNLTNLRGGIDAWALEIDNGMRRY